MNIYIDIYIYIYIIVNNENYCIIDQTQMVTTDYEHNNEIYDDNDYDDNTYFLIYIDSYKYIYGTSSLSKRYKYLLSKRIEDYIPVLTEQ